MKNLLPLAAVLFVLAIPAQARDWVTPDFFVERGKPLSPIQELTADEPVTDCRAHIAKIMCLVDPVPFGDEAKPRPCVEGGERYAHFFEELHDNYPPLMQRMFCSLSVIYVERKFDGTAYGGLREDAQGHPQGAVMGIRQSVLDERLDLSAWASWKEQLSFGGVADSYRLTPGLPVVRAATKPVANDFLYFVVSHEFGHIFDFANKLNWTTDECIDHGGAQPGAPDSARDRECRMGPQSWGALSWLTDRQPLVANDFPHRAGLCFYWCGAHPLARSTVLPLYDGLAATSFISIYSTTQPWDDFADSLAYFLVERQLGGRYELDSTQGRSYDVMAKLRAPVFAAKAAYLERFLTRTDIVYP